MAILVYLIVFVLFYSNTWPLQMVWRWLGGVAMTHADRRHGPAYIPRPWAVGHTSPSSSGLETLSTEKTVTMSPNMACDSLQAFSPRLTVAKRKEALELRKVSPATNLIHVFCCWFRQYNLDPNVLCCFQTMKPLMEKRRRARINDSLNHLKNLILPLTGRDVSVFYYYEWTRKKNTFRNTLVNE